MAESQTKLLKLVDEAIILAANEAGKGDREHRREWLAAYRALMSAKRGIPETL